MSTAWVIGKTEYMWDGGSDEDLDAIHASIRTVLTALQSATERADRAEAVLRVYADGKNWKYNSTPFTPDTSVRRSRYRLFPILSKTSASRTA